MEKIILMSLIFTSMAYAESYSEAGRIGISLSELQDKTASAVIAEYALKYKMKIEPSDVGDFVLESALQGKMTMSAGAPSADANDKIEFMPNYCEVNFESTNGVYHPTEVFCSKYD